ncbi:hypothetical protein OAE37_02895, partial [Pirellulaceae bacterium]|nr:hypothetical protein [Pirellulaceae bacterium]
QNVGKHPDVPDSQVLRVRGQVRSRVSLGEMQTVSITYCRLNQHGDRGTDGRRKSRPDINDRDLLGIVMGVRLAKSRPFMHC